jgi:hypothetical protein
MRELAASPEPREVLSARSERSSFGTWMPSKIGKKGSGWSFVLTGVFRDGTPATRHNRALNVYGCHSLKRRYCQAGKFHICRISFRGSFHLPAKRRRALLESNPPRDSRPSERTGRRSALPFRSFASSSLWPVLELVMPQKIPSRAALGSAFGTCQVPSLSTCFRKLFAAFRIAQAEECGEQARSQSGTRPRPLHVAPRVHAPARYPVHVTFLKLLRLLGVDCRAAPP